MDPRSDGSAPDLVINDTVINDTVISDTVISDAAIRLGQLLKLAGVADDGAEARAVLLSGTVRVDGEVETRRGRQIRPGDVVTVPAGGVDVTLTVSHR